MRRRRMLLAMLRAMVPSLFMGALLAYALWPWLPVHPRVRPGTTIVFYGFSILQEAIAEGVFPGFQKEWKAKTGQRVELTTAFAGSGTVTNQLISGVPADLGLLSTESDAMRLATAGVIEPGSWQSLPHRGILNRSPFVILVRPGNPKSIHDFQDLARPGIRVVHPDPLTSGAANWALLAEYGAGQRAHPEDPRAGHDLLLGIWRNVVAQAASAREARTQFQNGFGDALVTYEQEAVLDRRRGRLEADIVYPRSTVLSEHVQVVVPRNVTAAERPVVDAFLAYLWTEAGQRAFMAYGFRSVIDSLNRENKDFVAIRDPFLVDSLGGWSRAKDEIVEAVWKQQVLRELGR